MTRAIDTALEHEVLDAVAPIDRAVFSGSWSDGDEPERRLALIRASVGDHLRACPQYARYAERSGFSIDALREPRDLAAVPQIPTLAFKRAAISSCDEEDVVKRCTSSGTQGRRSVVLRDHGTVQRLLGTVRRGIELIGDWYDDEVAVVNLGPTRSRPATCGSHTS